MIKVKATYYYIVFLSLVAAIGGFYLAMIPL